MHLDEAEIKEIEDNLKVKQNGFEMFKTNPNFRRVIGLGVGLQLIQQLTGINVVMYFAPTIFKIAGFADTNAQMWGNVSPLWRAEHTLHHFLRDIRSGDEG